MKNVLVTLATILVLATTGNAQKYLTKTGHVWFFSDGAIEKIEAHNKQVNSALDISTGDLIFKVLMKSFEFQKALMQEHFNENYVESDKFPNATFKGKITNLQDINFKQNGSYKAIVEGDLTIHGITKRVKQNGTIEVKNGQLLAKSTFNILLSDYNISIPTAVVKSINNNTQLNVDLTLESLNK